MVKKESRLNNFFKKTASSLSNKGLIKKNSETFTGINLGNSSVKGLTVKQGKIIDYFVEPKKEISEIIDILSKKKKIGAKKIKISLKDPSCLVRYFSFPKVEKKKLKQSLFYQLNKLTPYPPEEVCFDYSVLKEIGPSQVYILLAVAKKNYIQSILESFERKGYLVSEITLDSISLMNLYLDQHSEDKENNVCILDIGHSFSTMNILEKGVPFLSREAKFNTKDVIDVISRIKNISEKKAIESLLKMGRKKEDFFDILEENISDWCKEIKNSFDFFELNRGQSINKLYVTGGLAAISVISEIFSQNLEVDAEILIPDASANLNFSSNFPKKDYQGYRHNLAACFGLVL